MAYVPGLHTDKTVGFTLYLAFCAVSFKEVGNPVWPECRQPRAHRGQYAELDDALPAACAAGDHANRSLVSRRSPRTLSAHARFPFMRMPRSWIVMQALIVVFVLAGMVIAITHLA